MEVERPVRELQERGRDELAVVGQDRESRSELETEATASGARNRHGVRTVGTPSARAAVLDLGRRLHLAPSGQPRRCGHDADELDVRMLGETPQGRDPERAAAEEDGPHARAAGSPVGHARALVASRTSASSSFEAPTAISSSIDSR